MTGILDKTGASKRETPLTILIFCDPVNVRAKKIVTAGAHKLMAVPEIT